MYYTLKKVNVNTNRDFSLAAKGVWGIFFATSRLRNARIRAFAVDLVCNQTHYLRSNLACRYGQRHIILLDLAQTTRNKEAT